MFDHNFWYWIVQGTWDIIDTAFLQQMPLHYEWGVTPEFLGIMSISLIVVITFFGTFIRLATLGIVGGIIMVLEGVRAAYAVYKWIKDLNPISG